jgi:hypothetical protein
LCSGCLQSIVEISRVEDRAQAKRMMNGALLILSRHALIVMELGEDDTDQQRMTIRIRREHRPATVARKCRKVGEKGRMGPHRQQRRALSRVASAITEAGSAAIAMGGNLLSCSTAMSCLSCRTHNGWPSRRMRMV